MIASCFIVVCVVEIANKEELTNKTDAIDFCPTCPIKLVSSHLSVKFAFGLLAFVKQKKDGIVCAF
jgi:hypothetical protein